MADLVPRRGDKRFAEVACLDGARTFQQSPDRACHAGADQHREQDAEDSGDCRQRGCDPNHVVLLLQRRRGIGSNERKHVGSNAIDLLVEFVTQGVDAGKAIGDTLGISAIEQGQQALDLGVEMTSTVIQHCIDARLDPRQRRAVGEARPLRDQPVDQGARGLAFTHDFRPLFVEYLARS
jgi:hypothetical protein